MASACSKNYSLVVNPSLAPTAWWTFEVGGATLTDVAHGNNLIWDSFGSDQAVSAAAGKVNLAATLAGPGIDSVYDTGTLAAFAYNAGDINAFFWLKIDAANTNFQTTIALWLASGSGASLELQNDGTWQLATDAETSGGAWPNGAAFVFFRLHYDSAAQKWGVGINGAAPTYQSTAGAEAPWPDGSVNVEIVNFGLGVPDTQQLDEFALFIGGTLTPDDLASIYNGGAGRTFP